MRSRQFKLRPLAQNTIDYGNGGVVPALNQLRVVDNYLTKLNNQPNFRNINFHNPPKSPHQEFCEATIDEFNLAEEDKIP